jgi:hypothetical protein
VLASSLEDSLLMPIPNCTLVFTKSVESVAAATVVGKD